MSEEYLNENLFTLGYSPKHGNKEMRGEFGIGFWSCINIANTGKIITRKDGETTFAESDFNIIRNAIKKYKDLNGDEITIHKEGAQRSESGTTIILEGKFETSELIEYAENIFALVEEKIIVNGKVVSQNSLEAFIRSD